jgi:hypothetical protein
MKQKKLLESKAKRSASQLSVIKERTFDEGVSDAKEEKDHIEEEKEQRPIFIEDQAFPLTLFQLKILLKDKSSRIDNELL